MEKPKDIRIQIQREEMTKKLMEKLMESLEEVKSGTANQQKKKLNFDDFDLPNDESFEEEPADD